MQLLKLRLTGLLSLLKAILWIQLNSGGEGSTISQDSASGTLQYKNVSEGSSLIDNDRNRTIHTSQLGPRSPEGLGTSPLQPPLPSHASTPTQPQTGALETIRSPSLSPGAHHVPSWLFDELYGGSDSSRSPASSLNLLPGIDPNEVLDAQVAAYLAQELLQQSLNAPLGCNASSDLSTPQASTPS